MYDNRRLFPIHMPDCVNCTHDINMHVTLIFSQTEISQRRERNENELRSESSK